MPSGFSLERYTELIRKLIDMGYKIRSFADAQPDQPHLILRHDIDMSIELAEAMAVTESKIGISSTYFVLLRSNLYNAFSDHGHKGLRGILELGHKVGLHFDTALYSDDRKTLENACLEECTALEACLGESVDIVSFHRPSKVLLGASGRFAGRRHAYEPRFFEEMGYCSDSRGAWYHGDPLHHEAVVAGRALQLLTHPIWWVGLQSESVTQRLDRLAFDNLDGFRRNLAANCEPYRTARVLSDSNERD